MAVIGGLVRRAGRVRANQDLHALDVLDGDLRKRQVDHRLVIGGGIRPGVPGAKDHRERLPGLVRVRAQRVKPVPVLVIPRRLLLLRVRGDQGGIDVDREGLRPAGKLPEPRSGARVRIADRVQQARHRRDPVDHPECGRVKRHRPKQRLLLTNPAEIRDALAAVREHHGEIADHPARIMTTPPLLDPRQPHRQRAGEPDLVRDPPEQRDPDVRHQPRPVRRDFYRYRASITHHLQGETSELGIQDFSNPRIPAQPDDFAPPNPGGASPTARTGLTDELSRYPTTSDLTRPRGTRGALARSQLVCGVLAEWFARLEASSCVQRSSGHKAAMEPVSRLKRQ